MWGVAMSRFASLFDSLSSAFFDDPVFAPIRARDLDDGQHRNPTNIPSTSPTRSFIVQKNYRRSFAAPVFERRSC